MPTPCCPQGFESLLDNLPDLAEGGDGDGVDEGAAVTAPHDALDTMSRQSLCALVRTLRCENADLQVRAQAAEMENAHFRKKLETTSQKLVNLASKKQKVSADA